MFDMYLSAVFHIQCWLDVRRGAARTTKHRQNMKVTLMAYSVRKSTLNRSLLLGVAGLSLAVGLVSPVVANPAIGDNCQSCHQGSKKMPATHPPVKDMTAQQCLSCHGDSVTDPSKASKISYTATLGLLSSSNIGQHRSNSVFSDAPLSMATGGTSSHSGHTSGEGDHSGEGEDVYGADDDADASGTRLHLGLEASTDAALAQDMSLRYGVAVTHDQFVDENLGRTNVRPSVTLALPYESAMAKLTTYMQRTIYAGSGSLEYDDFTSVGANLTYRQTLSPQVSISTSLRARVRSYDGESMWRDPDIGVGTSVKTLAPNGAVYTYGVSAVSRDNPKQDDHRYTGAWVFAGLNQTRSDTTHIGITGTVGGKAYKGVDRDYAVTRDDTFWDIGVSLADERFQVLSGTPRLTCHYTQTLSNIDAYDSDAAYCAVVVETRF